jgi:hypothetical protein
MARGLNHCKIIMAQNNDDVDFYSTLNIWMKVKMKKRLYKGARYRCQMVNAKMILFGNNCEDYTSSWLSLPK